jgi:uncharacterized OsmC-like protein
MTTRAQVSASGDGLHGSGIDQTKETLMQDILNKPSETVDIKQRQAPLRDSYVRQPSAALISDHATTRCDRVRPGDPLYTEVEFGDLDQSRLRISLHEGVGGHSDLPVPGELFSAAIASCLDSTIRVIANMLGLEIKTLEVAVEAFVDLRGTLRIDPDVPTAFQDIEVGINLVPVHPVPQAHLDAIIAAAEQSCVVLQTLRTPPCITVNQCAGQSDPSRRH